MSRAPMFSSLRHRNARLFFFGLLVSNVGTWMQMTAMSLLVYELTGKAADVGITLLCQFLPMLLLGVWAGALADRRDKRKMTLLTQGLLATQAIVLGVLYLVDLVNLPVMYGLSLLLGVIGAFDNPARRGFVLELVEPQEITNAISLNTAVMTGSRIVGPALAAALKGPLGAGWLFIINGAPFVALLWPLVAIDRSQLHASPPAQRGGTPVRDAIRFIVHDRRVLVVFRTPAAQHESSPARLRLLLQGTDTLQLRILKRRGPPLDEPLVLPARIPNLLIEAADSVFALGRSTLGPDIRYLKQLRGSAIGNTGPHDPIPDP